MPKFLITGVAGLTGAYLARKCLELGEEVVGVDNYFRGVEENIAELFPNPLFTFHKADFRDFMRGNDPRGFDGVYHLAAVVPTRYFYEAPELTYEVNCHGTYGIFRWALAGGVRRFVNASSSEIYGHPADIPLREDSMCRYDAVETTPRWSYAHGKIMTEYLLNAHKEEIDVCHLRYANVYGPYDLDENHVIPYILRSLLENKPLRLAAGAAMIRRSFLYMSDCADATWLAMRNMRTGESYNIANPEEIAIKDLYLLAKEIVERECGVSAASEPEYSLVRAGDPERRLLDIGRAERRLGYKPKIMLTEGLKKTALWMRKCLP